MIRQFLTKVSEHTGLTLALRSLVEWNFRTQRKAIREHLLPLTQSDRVLDLGCGTGVFAPLFPSAQYEGVDIDQKNISYATRHYPYHFQIGDAMNLPFQDGSFTRILVAGVLHHLSPAECVRVCAEMRRVLAHGGRALVMEDTKSARWITRLMHLLDQGAYIRTREEWEKLLGTHLQIERQWSFNNGVCFYSAFILTKD